MASYIIITALAGLVIGATIAWLISANRTSVARGEASAHRASIEELRKSSEKQANQAAEDFGKLRSELSAESQARVKAETESTEMKKHVEEQKKMLSEAESKLKDTFKALASDTLTNSNEAFLKLARETFDKVLLEAKGDFGKKQQAIDSLVKPIAESLKQFDGHVREVERLRESAYAGIKEQLKNLSATSQELHQETGNLVSALRTPQVRGRWGEMTLRRVVELSGMSEHCDFVEQVSVDTENGRHRPDMIVKLPSGREVVLDAKVSLMAYLDAVSATSEEDRTKAYVEHARQIRTHMKSLGTKSYWQQFSNAPEFVVMFIPGESFLAAAAHHDHELIEDGMEIKVVLATPTTLIALLKAIAFGWKQEQIAKSAQEISRMGTELHDRMRILVQHIAGIGKGLEKANSAYNDAVGSIERRVLPAARKMKELGAGGSEDIQRIEQIESSPRVLNPLELDLPEPKLSLGNDSEEFRSRN